MSVDSDKKLTRYTSAVTVVTADLMNSLYGGEHGSRFDLDEYDPLVSGHVHDGEHSDGHASKVLLDGGAHVRGHLAHANLGGTGGTAPAVQAVNIQCYSENNYGPHGGGHAIPQYTEDPDTGDRCYYLDLSMTVGGDDTHVQYNKDGEFAGDGGFVYKYENGRVGINTSDPRAELHIEDNNLGDGGATVLLVRNNLAVEPDDYLGWIGMRGNETSNDGLPAPGGGVTLSCRAEETFEAAAAGSYFTISTTSIGEITRTEKVRVSADGNIGIGTDSPTNKFEVVGGDSSFCDGKVILYGSPTNVSPSGCPVNDMVAYFDGDIDVTGNIDPTGIIFSEVNPSGDSGVPTATGKGALFVSDGTGGTDDKGYELEQNKLYYKDATGSIMDMRGARTLSELGDVDSGVSDPHPGHVLKYDGQSNTWKSMQDEAGTPADPDGSIQYNSGGVFAGDSTVLIKNSKLGVGVTGVNDPVRTLHIEDTTDNPPVRIDSLTAGVGRTVVWDENTGDLYYEDRNSVQPKIVTWPGTGDITIPAEYISNFIVIGGVWNGSGRVVIPGSPPEVGKEWEEGDFFWIKNLTSSGGGGSNSNTHGQGSGGFMAIEVVGDNSLDTLDGSPFNIPYVLPPKNAIQVCCAKGSSGETHWFLMSHYHELSYTPDTPPNATIKVSVVDPNDPETSIDVSNHGTITDAYTVVTISGLDSSDPDGDSIEEYVWAVIVDSESASDIPTNMGSFALEPSKLIGKTVYLTLSVRANGVESAQAVFDFTVDRANTAPVAVITSSSTTLETGSRIEVSGGSSYDDDGDSLTYAWTLLSIPVSSGVYIDGQTTNETVEFYPDVEGEYRFQLIVNDGQEDSSPATFPLNISQANTAPSASFVFEMDGSNVGGGVIQAGESVYINPTISDPQGDSLTITWEAKDATDNPIDTSEFLTTGAAFLWTPPADSGGVTVTLKVFDGELYADSNGYTQSLNVNAPPVASFTVGSGVVGDPIDLNSTSYDPESPESLTAIWSITDAAGSYTIADPTYLNTWFTPSAEGSYTIHLTVSDPDGGSATAQQTVSIIRSNENPTAYITGDTTGEVGTPVELSGEGSSDPDGDPISYSWTLVSAPETSAVTIDSSASTVSFSPDVQGDYEVKLTVSDDRTGSGEATITIPVAVPNEAPLIGDFDIYSGGELGGDILTGDLATISAFVSDYTDNIYSYKWTLESSPEGSTAAIDDTFNFYNNNPPKERTYSTDITPDLPGTYKIKLTVQDNHLLSSSKELTLNVEARSVNVGPTVGAISVSGGSDVRDTYNLSATITDDDGYVETKLWQVKSFPLNSNVTLSPSGMLSGNYGQSTVADATFSTDTPGSYTVHLVATDDDNDEGTNSKTFTVNDIPSNQAPTTRMMIGQTKMSGVVDSSTLASVSFKDYGSNSYIEINAEPSNVIFFDASQSSDSDGTVETWNWTVDCPAQSLFQPIEDQLNPPSSNTSSGRPPFLGYYPDESQRQIFYFRPDEAGTYVVHFYAKDNSGDSSQLVTIKITLST